MKKRVSLIVPVWVNSEKNWKMTVAAIDGMLETEYHDYDVVIVDDMSPMPGVHDALVAKYDGHPLVRRVAITPKNGGSTFAVNYGLQFTDAPFIQYQNTDTLFPKRDWLSRQMKYFVDPEVGIVGCLLRFPNGTIQHAGAAWIHENSRTIDHIGKNQPQIKPIYDVPLVTGCGMTVRREVLEKNGGGFTVFNGYGWDDIDIAVKAKKWGYKIKLAFDAEFTHFSNTTYSERKDLLNPENHIQNEKNFANVEVKYEETLPYFIANYYV